MRLNGNEDLGWLAFRYIADEMEPAEVESFEHRLLEDQAAREAVAEAVSWTQAVALERPARGRILFRRVRWLAAAAAAVAATLLVAHSTRNSTELRMLARTLAERLEPDSFGIHDPNLLAGSDDPPPIDDEVDLTVPTWMIEAVVGAEDSDKWEDI